MDINKIPYMRIIMFVLIGFILYNQVRIIHLILDKEEKLDADPFVYGAQQYDLEFCSCIVGQGRTLEFTKNYSKFILQNKPQETISFLDNYKEVK